MLVRRSQRPNGVIRGSWAIFKTGPCIWLNGSISALRISASSAIERNLYMTNGFPCLPARTCRKMAGPFDVSRMTDSDCRHWQQKNQDRNQRQEPVNRSLDQEAPRTHRDIDRKTSIGRPAKASKSGLAIDVWIKFRLTTPAHLLSHRRQWLVRRDLAGCDRRQRSRVKRRDGALLLPDARSVASRCRSDRQRQSKGVAPE